MHQPSPLAFQPAIYCCADCGIEYNGDVSALPPGWDRLQHPRTRRVTVTCPDCLDRIERQFAVAHCAPAPGPASITIGLVAAAYRGQLAPRAPRS